MTHSEHQAHIWSCLIHQQRWRVILDQAADRCHIALMKIKKTQIPTLKNVQELIHESRTFITKGIVSERFYDFIHQVIRSVSTSHQIILQVYNFIYRQVYTHIWIPRCVKVIAYERRLGLTNRMKRSRFKPKQRPNNPTPLLTYTMDPQLTEVQPWVSWFTASIRQGVNWLTHAYSTQADMFGSFTTSDLNSFTSHHNRTIIHNRLTLENNNRIRDRLVSVFFFM